MQYTLIFCNNCVSCRCFWSLRVLFAAISLSCITICSRADTSILSWIDIHCLDIKSITFFLYEIFLLNFKNINLATASADLCLIWSGYRSPISISSHTFCVWATTVWTFAFLGVSGFHITFHIFFTDFGFDDIITGGMLAGVCSRALVGDAGVGVCLPKNVLKNHGSMIWRSRDCAALFWTVSCTACIYVWALTR